MKLVDLGTANTCSVAAGKSFFRLQRAKVNGVTVKRGPLKLAPPGLRGRFDLATNVTAYLGETPETALYEAVMRREAILSPSDLCTLPEQRPRETGA